MEYHRYFVSLQPDGKGYDYKGKEPIGRCILESKGNKGKISLWVQDLKPEVLYKIVLVFLEKEQYTGVPLGTIFVDEKGKGEFKGEFPSVLMTDTLGLDSFTAVALLAPHRADLICPLVGYKDAPVLWKNHFSLYQAQNQDLTAAKASPDPIPTEAPQTEPETAPEEADGELTRVSNDTDVKASPEPEEIGEAITELEPLEAEKIEEEKIEEEKIEPEQIEAEPIENILEPEDLDPEESTTEPSMRHYEFFTAAQTQPHSPDDDKPFISFAPGLPSPLDELDSLFNHYIEMTPFAQQSKNLQWIRISYREPIYLPIDYQTLMNHPFLIAAYKKHKHFILGRVLQEIQNVFVFGVPGVYDGRYRALAHQLGFGQFKCCDDVKPADGQYGYWLQSVKF
jgi:hypothetical protein